MSRGKITDSIDSDDSTDTEPQPEPEPETEPEQAEPDRSTSSRSGERKAFTARLPEELVDELDSFVDGHTMIGSRNKALEYAVDELLDREHR